MSCEICDDEESGTRSYYGVQMCAECIQLEEGTDWDKFEADRRQRIAESNER